MCKTREKINDTIGGVVGSDLVEFARSYDFKRNSFISLPTIRKQVSLIIYKETMKSIFIAKWRSPYRYLFDRLLRKCIASQNINSINEISFDEAR